MAQRVVHRVAQRLASGCMPAWLSDGFKGYLPAILGHFGWWVHLARRHDKGPWPKPRWMPLPGLLYAQVIKQYRHRRMVGVQHRVVFGTLGAIEQVLSACGWKMNTPTTPLSLPLCFSALTMGKIRLVIAPLDPGHKGEALLNRIRLEGQHNLE